MSASPVPDHTPVIIGVGQLTERIESPDYRGLSNVELAAEAARRACDDALGAARLRPEIDTMAALRTFEHSARHRAEDGNLGTGRWRYTAMDGQ
jgi:acetyl-CoA C-acetyltransferase